MVLSHRSVACKIHNADPVATNANLNDYLLGITSLAKEVMFLVALVS